MLSLRRGEENIVRFDDRVTSEIMLESDGLEIESESTGGGAVSEMGAAVNVQLDLIGGGHL